MSERHIVTAIAGRSMNIQISHPTRQPRLQPDVRNGLELLVSAGADAGSLSTTTGVVVEWWPYGSEEPAT